VCLPQGKHTGSPLQCPNYFLNRGEAAVQKIGDVLEKIIKGILIILLLLLIGSIALQVLNRYVIHYSLPFLQWLIMLAFAWITFLGSAIAIRTKSHFDIDIIEKKLSSPTLKKGLLLLISGIILGCVIAIIVTGWSFLQIGLIKKSPATGYSMVWTYASIFVSGLIMAFFILERIVTHVWSKEEV
jgi:TRAP-type C4-dicarboxylate transport system permease small subunit